MTGGPPGGAAPALYLGQVMHQRLQPYRRHFVYRVFTVLLDIDRLAETAQATRLFSHNRFNLFGFHDRDHGPRDGSPLRPWIDRLLQANDLDLGDGRVELLCYPRVLGYVFNPLSVYFCHDAAGQLRALVHEVRNTFGETHSYVLPVEEPRGRGPIRQHCEKAFYVSPFLAPEGRYHFAIRPPADGVSVVIRQDGAEGPQLSASFVGRRGSFGDAALLGAFLRFPLMTLKVMAGIHWEALWIWLKGATFHRRPAPPAHAASHGPNMRPPDGTAPPGTLSPGPSR